MNENNANLCEMEQEIFQIKDKYKPYFELEKENRRLKIERLEMLHTAEKFLGRVKIFSHFSLQALA